MTAVFVIDDHPIVAHGVALVLDDEPDLEFAGSAGGLAEAISLLDTIRPDVILLDVRLPHTDVVTAVAALRKSSPSAKLLLFTADSGHPHIRRARAAGALATVAKDTAPVRLREIIRTIASGAPLCEPTSDSSLLTARQHDVLNLVAAGMTTTEIANELGIQPTTAKAYWQETMQRLDVRNRAEAIAIAYRRGLL